MTPGACKPSTYASLKTTSLLSASPRSPSVWLPRCCGAWRLPVAPARFWIFLRDVHGFSGGVHHMCMFLGGKVRIPNVHRYFGEFQMSIDILDYFSHDQPFFGSRKIQQMHHVFFGNMSIVHRISGKISYKRIGFLWPRRSLALVAIALDLTKK